MSGRQIFWYFLTFFCFIAAVNTVMVTYALRTHSGVVTEHPYETGLAYNKVIEAEEEQKALGWKGTIGYEDGVLRFTLTDADNAAIRPEKITATITRPIQVGMDFVVNIDSERTPIDFPTNGLWEVRIDAIHEGLQYQQSRRIIVP